MQILLNTILIEPNRHTADKTPQRPLIEHLPALQRAGFSALEIWQYHASALDARGLGQLSAHLDVCALRAAALGAYPFLHLEGPEGDEAIAQLGRTVAYAAHLGVDIFKIFPGRVASHQLDAAARTRSVHNLRELAQQLAARSIQLTLETHGNTLCDTRESTLQLLDELRDLDNVGICFQPYTNQDTNAAIALYDALAPHVLHVHLQNRALANGTCTLLEEGDWLDYRRLLPHIRDSGFDGPLSLEFTADMATPDSPQADLNRILDNAARDRDFALDTWGEQDASA